MSLALQGYYLCLICCSLSVSYFILNVKCFSTFFVPLPILAIVMLHQIKPSGAVSRINCKHEPWAMCLISRIITLPGLNEWMVSLEFRLRDNRFYFSVMTEQNKLNIWCLKYEIYHYCTSKFINSILRKPAIQIR